MTQKKGFELGIVIGFLILIGIIFYANPTPSVDDEVAEKNLEFLKNSIKVITMVSLILIPVVVYYPTFTNTFKRGLVVGMPWAFGIGGLTSEIAKIIP